MTLRRATWIVLAGLALWACGGSDGGNTTDTLEQDTASEVGPDGTAEETAEETTPDVSEPDPDVSEPDPDVTEPDPDVAEEATEVAEETTEAAEETTEVAEETTEVAEETTEVAEETETTTPESEFETMIGYLEGEGGDYLNTAAPKVVAAADVMAAGLETYVILDLRSKDLGAATADGFVLTPNGTVDFDEGHIDGAILVDWTQIVSYVQTNLTPDDKILIVCWTGQSASQASLMLNLLGYDASSLKWGMSGWNKIFDMWSAAISSDWAAQFTTDADTGKNAAGEYPVLATGETDAQAILEARIAEYSAGKAKSIKAVDLFNDLESYYVVNYWPEAEYLAPGHILGSHQYTPKTSLKTSADLATLPTDQKIVVYCYTGQQSAHVAAFLNLLGYDAYSLQYGTNGMIYDQMIKQQWTGPGDYAYVGGLPQPTEFETLIGHLEATDYLNTAAPKVVAAADVMVAGLDTYVILDLRSKDLGAATADGFVLTPNGTVDFDEGHIDGAILVDWTQIVSYVQTNLTPDDKILIVCWTGQSASQASLMLNLLGYDASSLKWGMSGWNKIFDMWSAAISSDWAAQFTTDADTGKNAAGEYPVLATGETDAQAILEARIAEYSAGKAKSIKAVDLFNDLESYYVVNYWPEAEYLAPGHILGSHQYTPKTSLKTSADLATLPTDQKIVVYCYTGQQSAHVAAFLNLLGYDAYSLQYGTNGMIYDQMIKQQWTGPGDYAYVGGLPQPTEFEKLIAHVEATDYMNTAFPKVVAATDVAQTLEEYVVLDIRTKDKYGPDGSDVWQMVANGTPDFDDGHIEGAVNLAWNEVVDYVTTNLTKDDKILVACYTGQEAGHPVMALNLLGYNAYSLKWGMSSWSADFDLWTASTGDTWAGQFTTDADTGKNAAGAYPVLDTGFDTAEEILAARIDALQASGTTRILDATTFFTTLEEFYVVNYWPEAEYLAPGHVTGAHQYTPKASLKTSAFLATLPTDQKIAVYCYTGQQSSQVAAFLTVLGYDAYSVKNGTNGMIYSQMTSQKWTLPGDYAYVQ